MNVDPIAFWLTLLAIVGVTLFYLGTPFILPALFLMWRRPTLTNPRAFLALAAVLCLLTRFLVYRGMGTSLTSLVSVENEWGLESFFKEWGIESFFMVVTLCWLERMFRAPKPDGGVLIGR